MKEVRDGGEAILEAFRCLHIDYIFSSPGSEWPPVWEALARQRATETQGPTYLNCWHESLAVTMAMGHTACTGRLPAVLLHTGVGILQGSIAIQGAYKGELPLLICSGESTSYGEDPTFEPGSQWYSSLSVVGGPNRFAEPFVKWSSQVTSPYTLYETVVRAGEMARRVPQGPVYLAVPMEVMVHEWTSTQRRAAVPAPLKTQPEAGAIRQAVELLRASKSPVIVTESAGRSVAPSTSWYNWQRRCQSPWWKRVRRCTRTFQRTTHSISVST